MGAPKNEKFAISTISNSAVHRPIVLKFHVLVLYGYTEAVIFVSLICLDRLKLEALNLVCISTMKSNFENIQKLGPIEVDVMQFT